jgi:CheY-like chemotaxis protein
MKVLIADDDPVCRDVLTMLLKKAGHQAVPFKDGASALAALKTPDAPQVAILDWMMPNLNGLEVCTQLRASNPRQRPYIIMYSALTEKSNIVSGLDAGADDYLPKPVNPSELMARLRVAERAILHQRELHSHIDQLEAMVKRYNLLGEMVARQGGEGGESPGPIIPPAVFPGSDVTLAGLSDRDITQVLARTLSDIGLDTANARPEADTVLTHSFAYTAWAGFILVNKKLWIDALLEATAEQMADLCNEFFHRPGQPGKSPDVLAEVQTILSAALKAAVQDRGAEVMAPLLSRVQAGGTVPKPPPIPGNRRCFLFDVAGSPLRLTIMATDCPSVQKRIEQLQPLDTLARPIFMPNLPAVPLLTEGVSMNHRHIERLSNLASASQQKLSVPVFAPSPLAAYYCR